jgi:hypothetical protein
MSEKITIGGRVFREVTRSTCAHDTWTMGLIRRAGLEGVDLAPGETMEQFSWRVLGTVLESGLLYELLGAFVVPEGVDDLNWTPDLAVETGRFVGNLYEPGDKAEVHRLVAALLLPFVRDGLGSLVTSLRSSAPGPGAIAGSVGTSTTASGEG